MTPRWGSLLLGAALALLGAGCGDGPTDPAGSSLEVVPVSSGDLFAVVGQEIRMEARVRSRGDGGPEPAVDVAWRVESGDAEILPEAIAGSISGPDGLVWTRLRLGPTPGVVSVRVSLLEDQATSTLLSVTVGSRPRLEAVEPTALVPGAPVTVEGAGFSSRPGDHVVLFSGIRGEVLSAATDRLEVRVPPCLPKREVEVTVLLDTLASEPVPATVEEEGGGGVEVVPGGWVDVAEPGAVGCLRLPGGGSWLILASSTSTLAGGRYPVDLRGLAGSADPGAAGSAPGRVRGAGPGGAAGSFAARWETDFRLADRPGADVLPAMPAPSPRAGVPEVGHRRSFRVFDGRGGLEEVSAVARHVGQEAVLYLDEAAPEDGFDDADLALLARRFDEEIHPTVTGSFGDESDLDGNGRVAILFTPVVNRLTPPGADGFVGGFFNGLDLTEGAGGNDGEVFYALVPDPEGIHSEPHGSEEVLEALPAVLAHEFQHMVHFNQRALLLGGGGTGALWLSEALAQMAEELTARLHLGRGEEGDAELYRRGNRLRARRYLTDPAGTSLVIASGKGSLAERGAGWLFVLHLVDRLGPEVLTELTRTTRTGVENVTAATGEGWAELLADWWSALYLDGADAEYDLAYPSVDLVELLAEEGEGWPLAAESLPADDFRRSDTLWSASARHYIVDAPAGRPLLLRLAGPEGSDAPAGSELGLRVLRLIDGVAPVARRR